MLPRADRVRMTHNNWFLRKQCPDGIGYDPISCAIARTDRIARSGSCHRFVMLAHLFERQKRPPPRRSQQLCCPLGRAIGISATHRIVFAITEYPFVIFVALVARYDDKGTWCFVAPERVTYVGRPDDVRQYRPYRVTERLAHKGLCR